MAEESQVVRLRVDCRELSSMMCSVRGAVRFCAWRAGHASFAVLYSHALAQAARE